MKYVQLTCVYKDDSTYYKTKNMQKIIFVCEHFYEWKQE